MLKTIAIPVAECLSHTKSEFYLLLRKSLEVAVKIANLSTSHCIKQDDFSEEKCGKVYTYKNLKGLAIGASFAVASIARNCEKAYKQSRWQVRHGKSSLRTYRSMPWPMLHNKSCKTMKVIDCVEYIEVSVKLLDTTVIVRLAGGTNHRDQISGLRKAIACNGVRDSKIWIDRKGKAILGFAVDVSPQEKTRTGEAQISSGIGYFAALMLPRSAVPFVINADDLLEWKAESTRRNQAWRQARKQGISRRRLKELSKKFAEKMNRRNKNKIHTIASQLVDKANRRNVATITIDFTIKSFIKEFAWHDLAKKIEYKAGLCGIKVREKTQSVVNPDCESPHVYFTYDPHSHRVKIGKTKGGKGRLESYWTSNPDWVLLAIDNQPSTKLASKEKYYHAMFDLYRVTERNKIGNELFEADSVIAWLRAVDWLGNAGNLSQIMQVLDLSEDKSRAGHLKADSGLFKTEDVLKCSQKADNEQGYSGLKPTAPAVIVTSNES